MTTRPVPACNDPACAASDSYVTGTGTAAGGTPMPPTDDPDAIRADIEATRSDLGDSVEALAAKAELARIGRYYATESMLVLDPATGRYDARATPSTGSDTLFDHYARLVRGDAVAERGDHAVF